MRSAAVIVVSRLSDHRVLMCLRSPEDRTAAGWCFPGGKCEPNESPIQTAFRELQEETGIQASYTGVLPKRRYLDFDISVVTAWVRGDPEITLSQEHLEFRWVSPQEALNLPLAGNATRSILGQLVHGKTLYWPLVNVAPIFPDAPGQFGAVRQYDIHTGMDLYCEVGTQVCAVEWGRVIKVEPFTGPSANPPTPWWNDTQAVLISGPNGILVYGEVQAHVQEGQTVQGGDVIGVVGTPVLKTYKGRPMTMLHFEQMLRGSTATLEWKLGEPQPDVLIDPTHLIMDAAGGQAPTFDRATYDGKQFRGP